MKTINLFLSFTLVAVAACDAVQPKPACKAQPAEYAAKYVMTGTPMGMCQDKILTGEILNVQQYRENPNKGDQPFSIAIEPQSVLDAVAQGQMAMAIVAGAGKTEFSIGKYGSYEPADNGICEAATMSETVVMVPELPGDPSAMPPVDPTPARTLHYKWSNVKVLVTPLSNAVYFGADLLRTDDDCIVSYKVSAVSPAVFCGDGTAKDDKGMDVPDPTTGKPNPDACKSVQGSGLNPYIDYTCDASADGMSGTHLCLPRDQFPTVRATPAL
jgi:hypothetical protein